MSDLVDKLRESIREDDKQALDHKEKLRQISHINDTIEIKKLWVQYWIAMATTGVAKDRNMSHGFSGPEFTDEEKIKDALDTAKSHIHSMSELVEKKVSLLSE